MGVDLLAPKASPVYSIAEGVVTRIGRGTRPTNGRGGFETAIAPGLEVGSFVDAGTLIGFVGISGNARHTPPHTHFELHQDGRAIDPYSLLVEAHERALMRVQWTRIAAIVNLIA